MTPDERDLARLAEVAELPEDHAERMAFVEDPHRRVLLREYEAFLEAEPAPSSRPDEARVALDTLLAAQASSAPRHASRPAPRRQRWWGAVAAVAAVVILAVGIRGMEPRLVGPSGVQRGGDTHGITLVAIESIADDVVFRWTRDPKADGYALQLFAADLSEVHRSDVVADTFLVLERATFEALDAETWRVTASKGGDEISRSRLGAVGDFLVGD